MTQARSRVGRSRNGAGLPATFGLVAFAVAGAFLWMTRPAPLTAQDVVVGSRQECRCVDRDGNEIENCTCIRAPRVNVVRPLMAGLMQRRSMIGVYVDYAQDEGVEADGGALITEIREDGPAARAGLEAGDVVLRVGGQSLTAPLEDAEAEAALDLDQSVLVQRFVHLVGDLEPEEAVELEVLREGERMTLSVTPERASGAFAIRVGEAPALFMDGREMLFDLRGLPGEEEVLRRELEERARARGEAPPRPMVWRFETPEGEAAFRLRGDTVPGPRAWALFESDPCLAMARAGGEGAFSILARSGRCVDGVELLELNPDLAEYFEAPDGGVLVTEVAEDSPLGLRAGDVLVAIDGREVRDPDHVRRILASYETDEEVRLRVIRRGREIEVLGRRRDG